MNRGRCRSAAFSAVFVVALPLVVSGQEIRLGAEFQVNIFTTGRQRFPSVAAEADGDFIVVWESYGQDGHLEGIFGARFSSAGGLLASEFQVNTYTTSGQIAPRVAADAEGDFVVVWQSNGSYSAIGQDGASGGVFARRFSSAGNPLASEFQVNTLTTGDQSVPSVAADSDGDFVVAWQSSDQDGSNAGIFARRFSSAGVALATEFQVNSYTPSNQRYPAVAADSVGDFVVAWQDKYHDGSGDEGVFARRFSSAGVALAAEFQVNVYTTNQQSNPTIAASSSGDFVVAWDSVYQDGSGHGVFARRFSSAGTPLATELQVNVAAAGNQVGPAVAAGSEGDFVVAWSRDSNYVLGRRFSSAGAPLASEFLVATYQTGNEFHPSLAVSASGDFVVAWQDGSRDGSDSGIFAQRFAGPAALDIDGNGLTEPLTDGLLVLRRFFGFTGATLTSGAVGAGCTRCDSAAIEPYLAGLGLVLDVDGNGATDALTDGLLALRYMFGFTGTTLTNGAVGGGCTRCDAAAIEPYLLGLL